jgi:hypothetical protein
MSIRVNSLHTKKPSGLAAAFGFVDFLLLVLVEDLEVGAPDQQLFWCYGVLELRQAHAQFLGYPKLEHEPVVLTQLAS